AKTEAAADEEGKAEYAFIIPSRLAGQPQFKGYTIVQMDLRVSDAAGHEEQKYHTFHVAVDPLQIEAIPESGRLIPGVENEIFLVASTPDGEAVQPPLTIRSKFLEKPLTVRCDENGIASIRLTPQKREEDGADLAVQNIALPQPEMPPLYISTEFNGKKIDVIKDLSLESGEAQLLLRVNQGVYRVGDVMEITALSAAAPSETVFLDIIKNGQTILTKTMRLKEGGSSLSLPIDNQLAGSLTLNGYIIGSGGTMVRDARQVVVLRNDDLRIEIAADQEQYEPGRPAQLKIAVTNEQGEPVRAALGVHIVDESVYSLTEKEPGLAKVFFAIERELLEPKVEIHGFQLDKVVRLSADDYHKNADLSKALLAKLDAFSEYGLQIDTAREKEEQANRDLNQIRSFTQWQVLPAVVHPMDVAEAMLFLQQKPDVVPNTDPWGRSYKLLLDQEKDDPEKENLFIVSHGRDGVLGTQDDIRLKNYNSPVIIMQATAAIGGPMEDDQVQSQNETGMAGDDHPVEVASTYRSVDENQEKFQYFFVQQPMNNLRVGGLAQFVKTAAGAVGGIVEGAPMLRNGMMGMGGMGMGEGVDTLDKWGAIASAVTAPPAPGEVADHALGVELGRQDFNGDGLQEHNLWFKEDAAELRERKEAEFAEIQEFQDLDLKVVEQLQSLGYVVGDDLKSGGPLVVGGRVDVNRLQQWMEKFNTEENLFQKEREQIAMLINEIRGLSPEEKEEIVQSQKSVRVRRYFPETLFYTPEMITDDNGFLSLNFPMADSITTWRMSAMANAKNGALGDATAALKVFKPFFIDLDLPVALIQH
ncbi:MAG: alpha-2-macroglobulin family protein, partial [Candidatus Hinthialibacter sp.]